ncbi:hypothetical protein OIU84_027195 [Salix udensis]|uniref:B3 domain-containing protein n=1 Tax=Salix udensis TaxID=889485 RepID=A0AAD6KEU5_9ROSI|nr:hypothetical protein OIU84_027195 [Salix udensis]
MEYMGRLISDDHDRDPLYFDFDREFDDDGDVEGFDGMLQHIREVTSDEDEALRLLTQKVAEKFVWYNVTSRKNNCLKDNNDARCVKPLETSEMRGNRDHIPFISKKKRSRQESRRKGSAEGKMREERVLRGRQGKKKRKVEKDFEVFLNDEENMELAKPKSETKGIEVELFDLTGASHIETMRLRKWDMNTSSCLMLTTSWKSVLNKGVLQENDFVQIYSFRRNENLCFVLIKVCDGQGCRDGAFGSRSNIAN